MGKHNQSRSLGSITDFQTTPDIQPDPADMRINQLERRIIQVESLLNNVMQQLDKPYRDQALTNGTAAPKKKKAKTDSKPVQQRKYKKQKQVEIQSAITFLEQTPEKLWKGDILRQAISENCNLSRNRATTIFKALRKKGHLEILTNVEVDGELLKGAFKITEKGCDNP